MYVSKETPIETRNCLLKVLARTEVIFYPGNFAFEEYPVNSIPHDRLTDSLALVRDSEVWSALVPARGSANEQFAVFSFHFEPGLDNSGFVGWLASHLNRRLGTGVFVICGQNSRRGGIFDYWGVPAEIRHSAEAEINRLRSKGGVGSRKSKDVPSKTDGGDSRGRV